MTDPSTAPDLPDAAEITKFLRRFADLMSNGQNATFLRRAAVLLENLTARLTAAIDQEHLWQSKYATVTHQASMLEAECDALKHDIEGHLIITTSILAERDELKATLEAREAELSELSGALNHARGELATKLEAHQEAMAGLRAAFDDERKALKATLEARGEELDQLRRDLEREREDCAAKSKTHQGELSELRLAFERERDELQAQLKVCGDELAALHVVSHRERGDRDLIVGETNAIVPKATLRQARAQFEYLAKECIPHGDIASQVMCELGAHTMDLALTAGGEGETDNLPAGEVALSIFAPPGSTSPAIADTM
jgi:DNA repair exonuclease SbcCD ATPase subunit